MNRPIFLLSLAILIFAVVKSENVGTGSEDEEFGSTTEDMNNYDENDIDDELQSSSGDQQNGLQDAKTQLPPWGWPFPWEQGNPNEKNKHEVEGKKENNEKEWDAWKSNKL